MKTGFTISKKAYERFANVVDRRGRSFTKKGYSNIYLDLVVKRFEFTYEMSWKCIKGYLDYIGIECYSPRGCFKEAFSQKLISDETIWVDMIEQRNLSSHIYDEDEIKEIFGKIVNYKSAFEKLLLSLEEKLKKKIHLVLDKEDDDKSLIGDQSWQIK